MQTIIIIETETRLVEPFETQKHLHFQPQPTREPYEVNQLEFHLEEETVMITCIDEVSRNKITSALEGYARLAGDGFIAPKYTFSKNGTNQIQYQGPTDALMEFLEIGQFISPSSIQNSPVKPRISAVLD